jgi:hypothetical protein
MLGHDDGRGKETAMRVRRPQALASERLTAAVCGIAIAAMLLIAVGGCGSPGSSSTTGKTTGAARRMTACGTTKTAANVPVNIHVARGQVACSVALAVERAYARAILSGKVPGTGGGAPVHVQGWTCQGFATPVVLRTGQASKCVDGGKEILAILPNPS